MLKIHIVLIYLRGKLEVDLSSCMCRVRGIIMNTSARYTAEEIADWFIAYNNVIMAESDAEYISNLKLQKLLYYAQGIYSALTDELLFKDDFVAWKHGPVVDIVYHKYKRYGSEGIKIEDDEDLFIISDEDTIKILEQVYNVFGQYSAWKLRNMTHEEYPWKSTDLNKIIDKEKIQDFFLKEYISVE